MNGTLTELKRRRQVLEANGVPLGFLDAADSPEDYGDLRWLAGSFGEAYFYIPQILHYEILRDATITPIWTDDGGETYLALHAREGETRFVRFGLESMDEFYRDYGTHVELMIAELLVRLYESSEESIDELSAIGVRIGFPNAQQLFQALERADANHERSTAEANRLWRARELPRIAGVTLG